MNSLALMVWIYDEPIVGNIVKLSAIVEPRRPLEDYRVGEEVKAKCHGFGIASGVIGKIVDETGRKDLEKILRGEGFKEMVLDITKSHQPLPSASDSCSKPEPPKKKKKEGKEVSTKRKPVALERVADDLEVTEAEQSFQEQLEETELMPVQGSQQNSHILPVRQALDLIDNTPLPAKVPRYQEVMPIHVPAVNGYLEQQISSLQQELGHANNRISMLESTCSQLQSNYSWLWNYVQQMQCNVAERQVEQQHVASCSSEQDSAGDAHQIPTSDASDEMIGGFTEKQLLSKVTGMTSFSKVAITLFRLLYKEEEYQGRTLTGAASLSGEKKPAVDQDRLGGIYRIVGQMFPAITPVMIRYALRDVVKPSRSNKTSKK